MTAPSAPRKLRRAAPWAAGLAAVGALALGLRPTPVEVEVAAAARGPIRVTVDGTGKTRVRDLYVVAAPVSGQLQRLSLQEGDQVRAGDVVAWVAAARPTPLDPRTRAELAGRLDAARAAEAEAHGALARARVAAEQAERDAARARQLAAGGSLSPAEAETTELARAARAEEARMAASAVRRAAGEAEAARAALAGAQARAGERVALRAPATGTVLRVHRESEGPIAAGAPVLDLGDRAHLEAEIELLTAQAVRVRPGAAADLVRWGGDAALPGRLARLDPAAFTKVSALGVEEQRIHAVVVPAGPGWERLGEGFAVEAQITAAERNDALLVPAAALFRDGERWAAFVVEGGRARLRHLELAESTASHAAVEKGLAAGERVVLHPSDKVRDGARVAVRTP
jgi:HlyD family secretion protein